MQKRMILVLCMFLGLTLVACGSQTGNQEEAPVPEADHVNLVGLKGPTTMGLVKLLEDDEKGLYAFSMAGAGDEIVAKLTKGEADIATIPSNLASVLYHKTNGSIQVLTANTLGVLYIVSTDPAISSVGDLKGKTLMATGQNTVPALSLQALLEKNDLVPNQDVIFDFKVEPTEVVAQLTQAGGTAMLPEPFVSAALSQVPGLARVLDVSGEWEEAYGTPMVTGVTVVRKDFAADNPNTVKAFLRDYEASVAFVNDAPKEAALLIEKAGIVKAPIAEKAIPTTSIVYLTGGDMEASISAYLRVLYDKDPASVGGNLPDDDFYYDAA